MAVAQGYGKTVTSGSVFVYDTGDTRNSYIGEPTTNLINPNVPYIYSWWTRNVQTITQLTETYKGQPIYRVSLSIDSGDMLYHITERWGAGSGWYMPYVMFNANTHYVASVIYRPVSHPDTRIYGHPSNIGGWGATVDGSTDIDNQWKIHRIDRNFGNTVGDNRFYHMHTPSATLGQTVTVDITNSQIEQKTHSTPFVNGTRSATQGLLPLVGNSTIDLTNVSFDSNAQMTFDGTNDYIDLGYAPFSGTGAFTIETVYTLNTTDTHTIIGNYPASSLQFMGRYGLYINGSCYFPSSLGPGTYYAAATRDGSGTCKLYLNGVLVNTVTNSTNIGTNSFRMGTNTGGGEVLNGKIPVMKLYNRALSASEVRQNYLHYKTRFNLS